VTPPLTAFVAQLAVPNSEPVIPTEALIVDAVTAPATNNEFSVASEPLTMTFFQFGIM
jgi:hypothetical protein